MNIKLMKLQDITPADYNPRVITEYELNQLKNSIHEFGLVVPLVYNIRTKTLISGHQRLKALLDLGVEETEVVLVDLDKDKEVALNIGLNKIQGSFDNEKLSILLEDLKNKDLLDKTGFNESELDNLLLELKKEQNANLEAQEDNFEAPKELENKYNVKVGDIFLLGKHKIMCGDSINEEQVKTLLDENKVLMIVTDPPYGVNYDPAWRDEVDKKGLLANNYPIRAMGKVLNDDKTDWSEAYKLFNPDIMYVWHYAIHTVDFANSITSSGYKLISQIIWVKPHFVLSRGDYHWRHEPCWYAVKEGKKHNWQGDRTQDTCWEIKGMNAFGASKEDIEQYTGHGTQKPVECMLRPILNNSIKGDLIADPFLGSGTTLIACEKTQRICYGMELSPEYISVIIDRYIKFKGSSKEVFKLENGKKIKLIQEENEDIFDKIDGN